MEESVLVLTPRPPWPLDDGGRIAMWQTVWSCAQEFRTRLVTLDAGPPDADAERALDALGVELVRVKHVLPSRLRSALGGLTSSWPDQIARYRSRELDRVLRATIARDRPLFALVNHLFLAGCADALSGVPFVLRTQNAEALWLERFAETQKNPAIRIYVRAQAKKMRRAEAAWCERADLVLAIHGEEARVLRSQAPRARIEALPLGIDFARYAIARHAPVPPVVLASATWSWPPNADGMDRFMATGWPVLQRRRPDARLRVAGKGLSPERAQRWKELGADVAGYVESMEEEFARASVLLVPVWTGAGIRVKIVEAAAAALPVVSTTLGAEGVELEPRTHFAIGDTPEELAIAVVELLDAPAVADAMALRALEHARLHYDLPMVARHMNQLCRDAARRTSAPA